MKYRFKFTVFTPCYNSERFIHRVYNSLKQQTFKDFEWLVIDDASTDNTLKILKSYKGEEKVNIRIIVNDTNQMITRNYNIAYKEANSKFFLALGHDDAIRKDTLSILNKIWKKYDADNIANICSMVKDQKGALIGNPFKKDIIVDNYFNVFLKNIYTKEKFNCTKTKILRKYLYEENGMRYIAEGDLWATLGLHYDSIFTNEVFRTYFIESDNLGALTKRSRLQLAESVMHSNIKWINYFLPKIKNGLTYKVRLYIQFGIYSLFKENGFLKSLKKIRRLKDKLIIILIIPCAAGIFFTLRLTNRL